MHMYGSVCVEVCIYCGVWFVVVAAGSMCTYGVRACRYVFVCGWVRGVFQKLIGRYVYVGVALCRRTWRVFVRAYDCSHRRRIAAAVKNSSSSSSINDIFFGHRFAHLCRMAAGRNAEASWEQWEVVCSMTRVMQ